MLEVLFNLLVVLFFVFLNGFFVAAEFAIVKVRSTQIEPLIKKGQLQARVAHEVVSHLDAYLSATQLGITLASLALGWIGEPFVAHMIEPWFEGLGIGNTALIQGVSFGVAFGIITFLHIVLGELAPKSLAIQKPQQTTLVIAYPLKMFAVVFKPIIWSLNTLANKLVALVGIEPASESERLHSEEELRLILAQGTEPDDASRAIALKAIDFKKKQARHVMVPRKEITALAEETPVQENIQRMRTSKYSRYPVYREDVDDIIGVVHTKDVFKPDRHHDPAFKLESVYRDATFLPETASLERTLETMLHKKTHMIILADEYGGTAGMVTLEDILEELVGTIQDEFDRETPEIIRITENEFIVDGNITTNDVERLLEMELSPKDILSIGGFITEQLGHFPEIGETLRLPEVELLVERVLDNAVERVRVRKVLQPPPADDPESASSM